MSRRNNRTRVLAVLLAAVLTLSLYACADGGEEFDESQYAGYTPGDVMPDVFEQQYSTADFAEEDKNLIEDGGFDQRGLAWTCYVEGGGSAMISNKEGTLQVKVAKGGNATHSVQVSYGGFKLHQYAEYELRFTASCSLKNKILEARIQYNGGDYHPYVTEYYKLTKEPLEYVIPFTMEDETDPEPRLAFNMGRSSDGSEKDADLNDYFVYFDDVSIVCTDNKQLCEPVELPDCDININQLGYEPDARKIAFFRGFCSSGSFDVVDEKGKTVYTGRITAPKANYNAWEYNWYGDFSSVTKPGRYTIKSEQFGQSYEFEIAEDIYREVFDDAVRFFYLQRCGCKLEAEHAGDWAHSACHNTMATIYGTRKSVEVSGGWHDAGDYGRYVIPGAKAAADLLLAYEAAPDAFTDSVGLPESGNDIPDVLDEVRYELEWMLKMQDASGGVYHKVTCASFPGFVMPQQETNELIVSPISDNATADFAAVMALSVRFYEDIDPAFAARCRKAALLAWDYIAKNDVHQFVNPEGIVTGDYSDQRDLDERFWGACELLRLTGEEKYSKVIDERVSASIFTGFGWADMGGYGIAAYLGMDDGLANASTKKRLHDALISGADYLLGQAEADGYRISLGSAYPWGSNMTAANNAMTLLIAGDCEENKDYAKCAKEHLDYLFGANPTAYCFVTGYGTNSPENPHHRPSAASGKPMPGMLVGGPNSALEDPYAKCALVLQPAAKCYVDHLDSYSCNEVAIYWNSPLVYIMARLCELD